MRKTSKLILMVIAVAFFTSCGGGGSSVLGNLPNLCLEQYKEQAKLEEEAKTLDKNDGEEYMSLWGKSLESKKKFQEEFDKEYKTLEGKEISTDFEAEVPCKLTQPIVFAPGKSNKQIIQFSGEFELTKDIEFQNNNSEGSGNIYLILMDNENKPIKSVFAGQMRETFIENEIVPAGKKVKITGSFYISDKNIDRVKNFTKITIVDSRNSKLYKEAIEIKD